MTTEGTWMDVDGAELREGDRVRWVDDDGVPGREFTITKVHCEVLGLYEHGGHWQRWTPAAPPVPDCGGHVGETFVGHVRPGQWVERWNGALLLCGGPGLGVCDWTDADERANPTHAVCPSCARERAK